MLFRLPLTGSTYNQKNNQTMELLFNAKLANMKATSNKDTCVKSGQQVSSNVGLTLCIFTSSLVEHLCI